jgi:limonene-1,2-epoxide hydrolase
VAARALGPPFFVALLLSLTLSACGGSDGSSTSGGVTTVPGGANAGDVAVIEKWAQALKRGDVSAAADYFAIPSVAENGPLLLRIHNAGQARAFNESLPCGAYVIRAQSIGRFTTATFRLTERPGPGTCGPGTGGTAQTSFVIRDGKIVEWRRVGTGGPGQAPPSSTA